MGRSSVQDIDVHQFRSRMEAFGRRQSMDQSRTGNPRKRPSQAEDEDQRPKLLRLDAWQPETPSTPVQRPQTLRSQRHYISQDEISNFALPSPAIHTYQHEEIDSGLVYDQLDYQYADSQPQSPERSSDHGTFYDLDQLYNYQRDRAVSSRDQFDDCDMLSTSCSQGSQMTWSEPSTPEDTRFGDRSTLHGMGTRDFVNLDGMEDVERNLLFALASSQKQDRQSTNDLSLPFRAAQSSSARYQTFVEMHTG